MDRRTFFDIMGTAPATVTVVTTLGPAGEPRGLTVGAVTSVSAEPPSLLISLDHRSKSLPDLLLAGRFAVNYLRGDRAEVSRRFSTPVADRFAGLEWQSGAMGMPILHADSLAWPECRIEQIVESGDHVVLIAAVEDGRPPPPRPRTLMYFRHHYEPWPGNVDDLLATAPQEGSLPARPTGRAPATGSTTGSVRRPPSSSRT
jgi:flavin reductase (DIM6/NTAB) family NADH-FMN oxidoreductase RutF